MPDDSNEHSQLVFFRILTVLSLGVVGCRSHPPSSSTSSPAPSASAAPLPSAAHANGNLCGDVTGKWSPAVDGLRARLVTSGARADRSALRIVLEIENTSATEAREVQWQGSIPVGFASFDLDDAQGHPVPAPDWRLGGNEPVGEVYLVVPASTSIRLLVADPSFGTMMGSRILRIGAFWGMPMPADGHGALLRARLKGQAPSPGRLLISQDSQSSNGVVVRQPAPTDPHGLPWTGALDVPAVCID